MSRHHILPPIIYTPAPKPKKVENRPKARGIRKAGVAASEDVDETEATGEVAGFAGPAGVAAHAPPDSSVPAEAAERRIPSTTGKLSENTLHALLQAQEQEQEQQGPAGIAGNAADTWK
jgi:hypothetical protein